MRMAGELQVDGMMHGNVGVVGLMREQDRAALGRYSAQRLIHMRTASKNIINPGYPDTCSGTLNVKIVVSKDGDPVQYEDAGDEPGIVIVIPEHPENAQRSVQIAQDLSAGLGVLCRVGVPAERRNSDVVTGQDNDVRLQFIRDPRRMPDQLGARL